jgi:hypothetical protein
MRGHRPEEMTDIISRLDDTHHLFFQQADCHAGLARRGESLPTVICALATLARVLDWRVALRANRFLGKRVDILRGRCG